MNTPGLPGGGEPGPPGGGAQGPQGGDPSMAVHPGLDEAAEAASNTGGEQDTTSMVSGVALVTGAAASTQVGSSLAALALPVLGSPAMVAVRQAVMAAVHLPLAWKALRRTPLRLWWWGVLVAAPLALMNLTFYIAVANMGVGLSVTIEFLGPLALSVIAARSRTGWLCAVAGFAGVVCVAGPSGSATPVGTVFALLAAVFWALYLWASSAAAARLDGLAPSAIAATTSALALLPIVFFTVDASRVTVTVVLLALGAGVLSSAIPYGADVLALRRLPLSLVSMLMSLHPASAAISGALILGERLGPVDLLGLGLISGANAVAVASTARRRARNRGAP